MQEILLLWDESDLVVKLVIAFWVLHPVASAIVAATETPKDDTLYGLFYHKILRPMALQIGLANDVPAKQR